MHCATKARSVCVPCCPFAARITLALSSSRAATPNLAFEGTAWRRRSASLHSADEAPQRNRLGRMSALESGRLPICKPRGVNAEGFILNRQE